MRGSDFLSCSGDLFIACFAGALASSRAVVFYLGATHVPDRFGRAVESAKAQSATGPRVFFVQDVGYLESADESVSAMFRGSECVNLVMSDTVIFNGTGCGGSSGTSGA